MSTGVYVFFYHPTPPPLCREGIGEKHLYKTILIFIKTSYKSVIKGYKSYHDDFYYINWGKKLNKWGERN